MAQLADREKAIDARIQQQDFIEDGETRAPCGLKPAQVHRQAEKDQDEKVAPLSLLFRVSHACAIEQKADENRQ
jgi:hypothetical protein